MRIDQFLKKTLLVKQRETAKELCDRGFITINGQHAKPARPVSVGDVIKIDSVDGQKQYRVIAIPGGNVKKSEGCQYYREEGAGHG